MMPIRDALTRAFDAQTLAELVAKPTATYVALSRMIVLPLQAERDSQFASDTLLGLEKSGYDLESFLRAAAEKHDGIPSRLAPIILRKHPASVPRRLSSAHSSASISFLVSSEPLLSLLRSLPHDERVSILRAASPGAPGAWPIWGLELHEPVILRKLVYVAVEASQGNRRTEVFELLRNGDPEVARVLQTVTVAPGSSYERAGAEFIREVVRAIEARRT